jgi:hypothetical protein
MSFGYGPFTDAGMDALGLQLKSKDFDGMLTDEHTDEKMRKMYEMDKRTKRKRKGLFSFFRKK